MSTRASQPLPRGFTLVELALVAATVAILAAIAVPRMTSASLSYRAELAARRVAGDIEMARQEAMATSTPRTITFDAARVAYTIVGSTDLNNAAGSYNVSLKSSPYEATSLRVKFGAVPPPTFLSYDGFGKANAGATITLSVGGQAKTISVDPNTGRAVVR